MEASNFFIHCHHFLFTKFLIVLMGQITSLFLCYYLHYYSLYFSQTFNCEKNHQHSQVKRNKQDNIKMKKPKFCFNGTNLLQVQITLSWC